MKRYTKIQLTKDIIAKLSTATNSYEVNFDTCTIRVIHTDENGITYVLSVFYEKNFSNEINDVFLALLKDSGINFNWLRVFEGDKVIFEEPRLLEFDNMIFDFIINSLEELAKKKASAAKSAKNAKVKKMKKQLDIVMHIVYLEWIMEMILCKFIIYL